MGKGVQKTDLDRLAKGLLVLSPNPNSKEYESLMISAVKKLNMELRSGKCINDALCSVLRAEACTMKHQLDQAFQAACVRNNVANPQQFHGAMFAGTRVMKGPRFS